MSDSLNELHTSVVLALDKGQLSHLQIELFQRCLRQQTPASCVYNKQVRKVNNAIKHYEYDVFQA